MKKYIIVFVLGAIFASVLFFAFRSALKVSDEKVQNDYYIIANQIQKMNKMVVIEQNFSSMQKTKISSELLGKSISFMKKEIVTFTKTNAQVSYNLNEMKIEVDSINKKLIIRNLPNAEIKITPSVEIQSMDDNFLNRINEEDLKKIQKYAKENAIKQVNQNQLRDEGKQQLIENLNQIFVLAKALNYTIEDKTGQIDFSLL